MEKELPPEYQRIEYIERVPEQEFVLSFLTLQEAEVKLEELNRLYPSCQYKMLTKGKMIPDHFEVVLPKGACLFLNDKDKNNVKPFVCPIQYVMNMPILYRFIDEEYIDDYCNNGHLRLSTFEKCKSLEDVIRQDNKEGKSTVIGTEGQYRCEIDAGVGSDAFLLCTSLSSSYTDKNYCLEIFDLTGLVNQIVMQLLQNYQVKQVLIGPCFYSEKKLYGKTENKISELLDATTGTNSFDFNLMFDLQSKLSGTNIYFQKPIEKSIENEYRVLWLVSPKPKNNYLDITINDPLRFARKIKCRK